MTMPKRSKGFTLLEVLIALAVLAISAMAVSRQMGNGLFLQGSLSAKTMAIAVADNEISSIMLAENWPDLGGNEKTVKWANREWQLSTDVNSTSEPWLREVTVNVFDEMSDGASLIEVKAYRGRY